jgi:hypothetical protein
VSLWISYSQRSGGVGARRKASSFSLTNAFNPCDFSEFLHALRTNEKIRTAECVSHGILGIAEDEWVLLIKALRSIKGIQHLETSCISGSRDFRSFQAIADAVNSTHSLRELGIYMEGETLPIGPSGLTALANALREHTTLREFTWADMCDRPAVQGTSPDFVLRALPACPHL